MYKDPRVKGPCGFNLRMKPAEAKVQLGRLEAELWQLRAALRDPFERLGFRDPKP